MKLLDNLYKIDEHNETSFRISLDAESAIYKAHFPEQPITPGVCIIQTATELFKILLDKELELEEVVNAKFLSVINPLETPEVVYNFSKIVKNDTDNSIKVSAMVSSDKTTCAKLSLIYKIND